MDITPDKSVYPKYYEFKDIKDLAIKESLTRRSQLLICKHDENTKNRDHIQHLLDENKRILLEFGIFIDEQWEMEPVWIEDVDGEEDS